MVLPRNDESSWVEMTDRLAWKRRIVLFGNDNSSCLEMTNRLGCERGIILFGNDKSVSRIRPVPDAQVWSGPVQSGLRSKIGPGPRIGRT